MAGCSEHPNQQVIMVCTTCPGRNLVCVDCVVTNHQGHTFRKLDTEVNTSGSILNGRDTEITRLHETIKTHLELIESTRVEKEKKFEAIRQKMEARSKLLHETVDEVANEMLEILTRESKDIVAFLEKEKERMSSFLDTTKHDVYVNGEGTYQSGSEMNLTSEADIEDRVKFLHFKAGNISKNEIKCMLGDITTESVQKNISCTNGKTIPVEENTCYTEEKNLPLIPTAPFPPNARSQITGSPLVVAESGDFKGYVFPLLHNRIPVPPPRSHAVDLPHHTITQSEAVFTAIPTFIHSHSYGVGFICPSPSGQSWVKSLHVNNIQLTDKAGHVSQTISFKSTICGMTMADDGRLLLCCPNEKCIKQVLLPNCNVYPALSTSPLLPRYLCTAPSGELLVTMCDVVDYNVTPNSTRVVAKFNDKGEEISRAQYDRLGLNLFTVSSKVCVNRSGDTVVVINSTSQSASHLVLLDLNLDLILRYTGNGSIVMAGDKFAHISDKFLVNDVNFDACSNIIIAEAVSKSVHLLDPMCRSLRTLITGSVSPSALAVHNDGQIWIGYFNGRVKVI